MSQISNSEETLEIKEPDQKVVNVALESAVTNNTNDHGNDFNASKSWTNFEKIAFRFAFIFFGIFCIPLDWGFYRFLYNLDYTHITYGNLTEIVAFFNPQFISVFSESGFFGWQSYINVPFVFAIAAVGTFIWTKLDKNRTEYRNLYYWVRVLARYRVAYAGVAWGYKKLFIMQMPFPTIGLQHTELIDFFAKRLYWEHIGISPYYEVFLGSAEFLAGFLLLFRKTTGIGAALAFIVFGNIAIANHAYDIGEQVPSALMAMLALFILWYDAPAIYKLLVKQENVRLVHYYPSFPVKWQNYIRLSIKWAFNFVFVILFFGLEVYGFTHNDFYKIPNTTGLKDSQGFYNVTEFKLNGKLVPYSPKDSIRWQDATFEKWSSISFKVVNRPQQIEMFAAGSYPRLGEVYNNKWTFSLEGDIRRFGSEKKRKKRDPSKRDLGINWELSGLGGERHYYYYKADTVNKILYLQNKNREERDQKQVLHYSRPSKFRIILEGKNEFNDSIYVVLDKDQEVLPLLRDGRKPVPEWYERNK
ncbi:MAG: hypothetical protein JWQ25_1531 [Daejeonella sp.]|nr:hypothetical protein [Daejeonella sp.]